MRPILPGAVIIEPGSSKKTKTGDWRAVRPERREKLSPCTAKCPIGNQIPKILHFLAEGKTREAVEKLLETNPLPAVCGRVCYHPCEDECNRREFDEPVAIRSLERFLGDLAQELNLPPDPPREPEVAVVGSGPAGLSCAYHLARLGRGSVVFEKNPVVGGMLAVGIPEYRLPGDVLKKEISRLEKMGVKFVVNKAIKSLSELGDFKAVFIGVGATKGVRLRIPGEEAEGVYQGIEFLKALRLGQVPKVGKLCLVVGGGNTAIDCARCARRLGAEVTILYRRSREEMPASAEEVEEALIEGVKIEFLVAPKEVLTRDGKAVGLRCVRMKLGPPDESGRPRPIPIEGSEFDLAADSIIAAIGQEPDLSLLPPEIPTKKGKIVCDEWGRTPLKGVFAGGDVVYGTPEKVADAIASGKRAAVAIDCFLRGKEPAAETAPPKVTFKELNLAYFKHSPRATPASLPLSPRLRTFEETLKGFDAQTAKGEAERCFSCGVCNQCDNCWLYCPEMAVERKNSEYEINYDFCKGCSICATECPRKVIDMTPEG
jgi:2-oxoacid:acceptor oxidoreductase delta subunit (pyruvate/2-ketoisovalerate family)